MFNISGFGIQVQLRASVTFPIGTTLTQFADDADPYDAPSIQLADKASGVNGDLLVWSKANPILVTLNIIPNSDDDQNMAILAEANRAGRGKKSARDIITLTVQYPDGRSNTLSSGFLTDAMIMDSVASASRYKSKPYIFAFEGLSRS